LSIIPYIYPFILSLPTLKRDIYQSLKEWKESNSRRPLLLRGARQTGKTFIVQQFGLTPVKNILIPCPLGTKCPLFFLSGNLWTSIIQNRP
jgi:hypothetical protein